MEDYVEVERGSEKRTVNSSMLEFMRRRGWKAVETKRPAGEAKKPAKKPEATKKDAPEPKRAPEEDL